MTQFVFCRHFLKAIASIALGFSLYAQPVLACSLPADFPADYRKIYEFTKDLHVTSIHGVDECLGMEERPLQWSIECDSSGNFSSLKAEIFLLPKVTMSFNDKYELSLENFYFSDWSYSKVEPSEVAEVFVRNNKELKLIYTTQSARKVHLTFVKGSASKLTTLETLVYKMNIGTPSLESKFSCSEM